MNFQQKTLSEKELVELFKIEEDHFNDYKSKDISGRGFSKIVSAFGNASGGEIYLGIREEKDTKMKHWEGFPNIEAANEFLQILNSLPSVENFYEIDYLRHPVLMTYVLKISIFKTQAIVYTTDKKIFVRKGAQSLPVDTPEKIRRIELDKGIVSYENEPIGESRIEDATQSEIYKTFSQAIIPEVAPIEWLKKQRLLVDDKMTVAGEMLFSDEPQICLPKRS